jgi:periplasmic protein TonB
MFSNLIESSSHAKEFKRRGSFFLFTTATYVVLFVVTGVISIYAYDARLEQQSHELTVLLPPQEVIFDVQPAAPTERPRAARDNSNESNIPTREIPTATIDTPERPPVDISTGPNTNLPAPKGIYTIGPEVTPPGPGGGAANSSGGGSRQVAPSRPIQVEEPPPPPEQPKVPKVISKGPITGSATSLPQPRYPTIAKQAGVQGRVSVQVLIDEKGNVISATAIDGHPTLRVAAQKAALQAKFSPTTLSGLPVRVSGVITYDFRLMR